MKPIALDCEVYPNYFLVSFKRVHDGKTISVEARGKDAKLSNEQIASLKSKLKKTTFGFNSINYDLPILAAALKGLSCERIHQVSDAIIEQRLRSWQTMRQFELQDFERDHFDLMEPSPGVMISLKLYGARMHSKHLQDLPIEPGTVLTEQQMDEIKTYCENDLDTTIELYHVVADRIQLRLDMSVDPSKSDAQMAEAIIKSVLKGNPKAPKLHSMTTYRYEMPRNIQFETTELDDLYWDIKNQDFGLDKKGSISLPKEIRDTKIKLGQSTYQLGIGGLHSTEKRQAAVPTEGQILVDRDVESYYPNIILNNALYPSHLGMQFLKKYASILYQRIDAKHRGDKTTADGLKIAVNGTFGKLGSKYSFLYSPDLLLQVTLTGQLTLLMLIERLELAGISVVSANTDGFVSLIDKADYKKYDDICFDWELDTGYKLEETRYKALYSRDVNNYLAITEDGAKGKGIFTKAGLMKNPQMQICAEAVEAYLIRGTPIEDTIRGCTDQTKFLTVRSVTGGALWRGEYLGRVVRWIWSADGEKIVYKKNGNKVATSDGARPIMTLGEFPLDIDYERYIQNAKDILESVGC